MSEGLVGFLVTLTVGAVALCWVVSALAGAPLWVPTTVSAVVVAAIGVGVLIGHRIGEGYEH